MALVIAVQVNLQETTVALASLVPTWRELLGILIFIVIVIYLWISAKREERKKCEKQEQELISRLPADDWRIVPDGEELARQEFAMKVLRDQFISHLLRPLVVGDDDQKRLWVFRYCAGGMGGLDECSDSAVIVVRDSTWKLPPIALVARRWRGLASRQPLRDLGIDSPELIECWAVEDGPDERQIESTRKLVQAVLPTMQQSEPLCRADFHGAYLACVGAHASSVDAYMQLLPVARRLAAKLDCLLRKG
jgi:hypothetical protein